MYHHYHDNYSSLSLSHSLSLSLSHSLSLSPPLPSLPCRQWRQQQTEMLAKKDAEEAAALEELKTQARKELAEWYARHDEQLTQTRASNR